ncbi:MAG: polysaccharide biosynthesis/export family protein [Candidatus Eisenbacteria bacterium]|nr:polysaccharide biosynthesis/export family protein [Candidatus Eisenbacteria bacterium]
MARVVRAGALALAGAVMLMAPGCSPRPTVRAAPPVVETAGTGAAAYRLRPGDAVWIDFLTDASMSLEVPVTPAGTITLPLAGDLKAVEKTTEELAADIREHMSPYLIDPAVSVVVKELGARPVFVIGEVRSPGRVASTEPLTVTRAIAAVGGLLPTAQPRSIMILRSEGVAEPTAYKVDLTLVLSGKDLTHDVELVPNDVVYVSQSLIGDVGEFVSLFFESILPAQLFYLRGYDIVNPERRGLW